MFAEITLLIWSALALAWWVISWRLVDRNAAVTRDDSEPGEAANEPPRLTVFKPLPPLGGDEFNSRGLESFIAQLDERSEMLLGPHEIDRTRIEPWLVEMKRSYPQAQVRAIWRNRSNDLANPKVSGLKILAPHATGEQWLWSDADIVAPPGFLRAARAEYEASGARMVTWPYVVRDMEHAPALLDALFVNAEFFPGVLLLRRRGSVDFGFGAAMLFSRENFERAVPWPELGAVLADDFMLGQKLRPVRIGQTILTTRAEVKTWRAAILHYMRWSKTVRWNRPLGTAARIAVLPAFGWAVLIALQPSDPVAWLGLAAVMQMDVFFAARICRRVGCLFRARDLVAAELWSVGRILIWLLCWLPGPVIWRGRSWWRPIDKT